MVACWRIVKLSFAVTTKIVQQAPGGWYVEGVINHELVGHAAFVVASGIGDNAVILSLNRRQTGHRIDWERVCNIEGFWRSTGWTGLELLA